VRHDGNFSLTGTVPITSVIASATLHGLSFEGFFGKQRIHSFRTYKGTPN
jgi:hypothetical protein